jgi:hypothetical protein
MTERFFIILLLALLLCGLTACEDRKSSMKGQRNASITFYGKAVDQDGNPLPGVRVVYQSEAFPADWSFEKRGEPLVTEKVEAMSGDDGRFDFTVDTHVLRRIEVSGPPGYRHFFEEYAGTLPNRVVPSTYGYLVISWGDLCFKSDAKHPAIYVFVKNGVKEVSALPCQGGYSGKEGRWILNTPAWPVKPSLKDVVQKKAATEPSTRPAV